MVVNISNKSTFVESNIFVSDHTILGLRLDNLTPFFIYCMVMLDVYSMLDIRFKSKNGNSLKIYLKWLKWG